jgi:hypothetical protein
LLDQSFEDPGTMAQPGFDGCESVLAIGLPNDEISGALQQGQERDEEEEQPTPKTAEAKFQR